MEKCCREYLNRITDDLRKKNRHFVPDKFLNELREICQKLAKNCYTEDEEDIIPSGIVYRARLYDEDDAVSKVNHIDDTNKGNWGGYDAKNSDCSPNASMNRMNNEGVSVLYASTTPEVAIRELYPASRDYLSVATIELIKPIKVVDFSQDSANWPGDIKKKSTQQGINNDNWLRDLALLIQYRISSGGNNPQKDYIFPQFIADFCKKEGYDGIAYHSKFSLQKEAHKGKFNIVLFDTSDDQRKYNIVSSKFRAANTMPEYQQRLKKDRKDS